MSRLLAAMLATATFIAPATASSIIELPKLDGEPQSVLTLGKAETAPERSAARSDQPRSATPMLMRAGVTDPGTPGDARTAPPEAGADASVDEQTEAD